MPLVIFSASLLTYQPMSALFIALIWGIYMFKTITALLLLIISNYSAAGSIYYGLHTDHTVSGVFNERNNVVIAQFDNGLAVGSMVNSQWADSKLFGYVQPDKTVAFGVLFATGYLPRDFYLDKYLDSTPIFPLPVLSINIDIVKNLSISTNAIAGIAINTGIKFSF